jgi:hypothetical protein
MRDFSVYYSLFTSAFDPPQVSLFLSFFFLSFFFFSLLTRHKNYNNNINKKQHGEYSQQKMMSPSIRQNFAPQLAHLQVIRANERGEGLVSEEGGEQIVQRH